MDTDADTDTGTRRWHTPSGSPGARSVLFAEGLAQLGFLLVAEVRADELGVCLSEGAADSVDDGVTASCTLLVKSSLVPTSVMKPIRAPVATPIAAPTRTSLELELHAVLRGLTG